MQTSEEPDRPVAGKVRGYIALAVLIVGLASVVVGYGTVAVEAVAALL